MKMLGIFLWTFAMLGAAVYAQYRIPFHTATAAQSWVTRIMLGIIGIGVGLMAVSRAQATEGPLLLAFLNGFGAVHVPAAFILFLKRQRGKEAKQRSSML
jgi:NAD/NADP transhydrogenase beta subunit